MKELYARGGRDRGARSCAPASGSVSHGLAAGRDTRPDTSKGVRPFLLFRSESACSSSDAGPMEYACSRRRLGVIRRGMNSSSWGDQNCCLAGSWQKPGSVRRERVFQSWAVAGEAEAALSGARACRPRVQTVSGRSFARRQTTAVMRSWRRMTVVRCSRARLAQLKRGVLCCFRLLEPAGPTASAIWQNSQRSERRPWRAAFPCVTGRHPGRSPAH